MQLSFLSQRHSPLFIFNIICLKLIDSNIITQLIIDIKIFIQYKMHKLKILILIKSL